MILGKSPSEGERIVLRPVVITVGNELIYGERSDDNRIWMLAKLQEAGIAAHLALTLPDDEHEISRWIRILKTYSYVPIFISGGIGGTHDDRTRQGIAIGLDRSLICHKECFDILRQRYGRNFTEQRQRMAWLPEGSLLISNKLGAPGFFIDNIYAFPGFPEMLQPMFMWVIEQLNPNPKEVWITREWHLPVSEGVIAQEVEKFVEKHSTVSVGLYPHIGSNGPEVTVRIRYQARDAELLSPFESLLRPYLYKGTRNEKGEGS